MVKPLLFLNVTKKYYFLFIYDDKNYSLLMIILMLIACSRIYIFHCIKWKLNVITMLFGSLVKKTKHGWNTLCYRISNAQDRNFIWNEVATYFNHTSRKFYTFNAIEMLAYYDSQT